MTTEVCLYQNRVLPLAEVVLPYNRGLAFGDGVFETLLVVRGEVQRLALHRARMLCGLQVLGLDVAEPDWPAAVMALWQAAGCPAHARLKWMVWRKGGGAYLSQEGASDAVLILTALPHNSFCTGGPVRLTSTTGVTPPFMSVELGKTLSALHYVLAARQAQAQGADHALLLDAQGHVLETEHANVVFWHEHALHVCMGGIPGIMQQWIQQRARQDNVLCHTGLYTMARVMAADWVGITNSIIGCRRVAQIDGKTLSHNPHAEARLRTWAMS